MENNDRPYSFNPRVPRELKMFTEMIVELFQSYEGLKWSRDSNEEIGFYYKEKPIKCDVFFGIWYDLWEQFGIPLSIVVNYYDTAPIEFHNKLKSYIISKKIEGGRVEYFGDFTCLLFDYPFFEFDRGDDIKRLSILFKCRNK